MNFIDSSQRERWLFKPDKLEEIRKSNRSRSIDIIKRMRAESNATESSGGQNAHNESATREPGGAEQRVKAIKLDDELKLLKYYQMQIQKICCNLQPPLPSKVQATAITYLKRFYLTFSTLDHDPKNIMLTVIYLACKAEENYISAEHFCKQVKQDQQVVLRTELTLLEGLKFDLVVFNPYRPLEGFFQELEEWRPDPAGGCDAELRKAEPARLAMAKQASKAAVDALMLTDAPLLFPPGGIALAAMRSGFRKAGLPLASFLPQVAKQAPRSGSGGQPDSVETRVNQLKAMLDSIDPLGAAGATPVNDDEVRKIDRRLKACHNPLLDPESAAFKRAEAEKAQESRRMRELKVQARQVATQASEAQLLGMFAQAASSNGLHLHPLPTIGEGQPASPGGAAATAGDLGSMEVPEAQPAKRRKSEDPASLRAR